jgi:glycosyltransferase involved in cell wall biosynthesis
MTDQLVAAGVAPREKFTTIYSGMEVEPFLNSAEQRDRVRYKLGYNQDDIVVGKLARLFHLKGHADLIEAAREACAKNPQLKILLVGDGILRPQIEARIRAFGLADRFQFTGLVPPVRIPELLAATDFVVHTSLREGLARVLPQSLLAGRPVISYDIDGAREVVHDGVTGYLVAPGDIQTLGARIDELSKSPTLRHNFATVGREECRTRFDHHEMTRQIRVLYERLLA